MKQEDLVWETSVEWVIREHRSLSPSDQKELIDWLNMDPAHRAAYEEASRLWLLTGFVPPSVPPSGD
ncbi:MAG: FecR/PupR family sigma factor regulator [Nitrosospira sp.]|nr:FecR/PupR family sigma factor regulator [Nitrosospira sp.]